MGRGLRLPPFFMGARLFLFTIAILRTKYLLYNLINIFANALKIPIHARIVKSYHIHTVFLQNIGTKNIFLIFLEGIVLRTV